MDAQYQERRLTVAGIGPGGRDYVTPAVLKVIAKTSVLAGGRRVLRDFARPGQELIEITGDLTASIGKIREKLAVSSVTVLVSGDPGFYSLLPRLKKEFPAEIFRVLPGISSLQLAFARLGREWRSSVLTSLHGRTAPEDVWDYAPGRSLGLLTDRVHTPAVIAGRLLTAGWPPAGDCWVLADLSYPEEKIDRLTLRAMTEFTGGENCVVIVG
jgi:cobalt-precorrin-7 (C5)-methyltransferase